MVTCQKLQHIGIVVPDADVSAKWYVEKSGFYKKAEFYAGGSKVIFVCHKASGVMCELIQRPSGSAEADEIAAHGAKIDHIAYEAENLEAQLEAAKACGMDIIEGIVDVPEFWERGFQYILVRACGGEKVEYCRVL